VSQPERFVVREAILSERGTSSVWVLTLRRFGRSTDPDKDLILYVSPDKSDQMDFAVPYTRDELAAAFEDSQ
jgi:hypothetical protein